MRVAEVPIIAVVDDDVAVRSSAANLIRSLGFKALPFASGEELMGSPSLDEIACVITDVQMPGMTGLELQSHLLASSRRVPIIFITAYPDERARRHALAAGAIGFFSKPFEGAAMIRCIDTALSSARAGSPE